MPGLDAYWAAYDRTLVRVSTEKPATVDALVAILNTFEAPSSGVAFFGNNADEHLSDALSAADWDIYFIEADYLWEARSPSGEWLHSVEGDIYPGRLSPPAEGA